LEDLDVDGSFVQVDLKREWEDVCWINVVQDWYNGGLLWIR
jgi:hypothetical protein